MFKIFDFEMNLIAETTKVAEAHSFARMYSHGSEDRNSCNVWIHEAESEFSDSEAIAFYNGGIRYDRKRG